MADPTPEEITKARGIVLEHLGMAGPSFEKVPLAPREGRLVLNIASALAAEREKAKLTQPRCSCCVLVAEFLSDRRQADRLHRLVQSGVKECIAAHGPVTRALVPSAAKRITRNIRNSLRNLYQGESDVGHCMPPVPDEVSVNGNLPGSREPGSLDHAGKTHPGPAIRIAG